MYKQKILNDFYVELFSTNYNDYPSPTQNAKTDNICQNPNIEFDEWLNYLVEAFCRDFPSRDNPQYTTQQVVNAMNKEPKFLDDIKEEFDYLKEEMKDLLDDYEEEDED